MKIVIQRVQSASVVIEDSTVGAIKQGLLLLVGVGPEDKIGRASCRERV